MEEDVEQLEMAGRADLPGPAFLRACEKILLDISAVAIVILGILVTASVLGRLLVGKTIPDDIVFSGELMVTLVALPWAYITADRGHIAVEVFTNWAGPTIQLWLRLLAGIVAMIMVFPLAWASAEVFWADWEYGAYFDGEFYLPQWPGRLAFAIGFGLMALRFVLLFLRDGSALGTGRSDPTHHNDEMF